MTEDEMMLLSNMQRKQDEENVFTSEAAENVVLRQITLYFEDGTYLVINDTNRLS